MTVQKKKIKVGRVITYVVITLIGIIMLYPVLWLLSSSFKPENIIFSEEGLWPSHFTLQNYIQGWHIIDGMSFGLFFKNSLIISSINVIANLISCSMVAYAFARLNFPLKKLWFGCMLMTLMLPVHVTLVPQYAIFHYLGWINTFLPLTVPKFFATDAFFVFLLVQFIRGIPKELDESAIMDGCGIIRIYFKIVLPLAVPSLITTAIFSFIWTWDDFFSQMLYLNSTDKYTVTLGLKLFLDSSGNSEWGAMFAMSVLSILPITIIFFFFQKYIVEGIATSGIKG
ncbi:carbohydrate ABC transporter permease [Pullulanibacillus sp. KACC 23026]|uniref:carbohydrate ABC transporter permease n=1 Tax=Pullulanibacillus sp. KACC 23026 TaxID=3028315 RepID=UPI0023B0C4F6|nr:carbohydrate ABC transporter permease [Pullulanibacillus sp. KACC 23026]WEG14889.1 carbohydrate ABC transporter permease [Pullulanibacillus sp. KACC 23026]